MTKDKSEALEMLDFVANKFEEEPWTFSYDTGDLKHIRYRRDYTGYDAWYRRVWRAFGPNLWGPRDNLDKIFHKSWWDKIRLGTLVAHVKVNLAKENNLPDGVVQGCGVIAHWSENGIFISLMNPDVSNAVLDFIKDRPEDKHAIRMREAIEAAHARNMEGAR